MFPKWKKLEVKMNNYTVVGIAPGGKTLGWREKAANIGEAWRIADAIMEKVGGYVQEVSREEVAEHAA